MNVAKTKTRNKYKHIRRLYVVYPNNDRKKKFGKLATRKTDKTNNFPQERKRALYVVYPENRQREKVWKICDPKNGQDNNSPQECDVYVRSYVHKPTYVHVRTHSQKKFGNFGASAADKKRTRPNSDRGPLGQLKTLTRNWRTAWAMC